MPVTGRSNLTDCVCVCASSADSNLNSPMGVTHPRIKAADPQPQKDGKVVERTTANFFRAARREKVTLRFSPGLKNGSACLTDLFRTRVY